MDTRKDSYFHKTIIKKHSRIYNDVCSMIEYHDLKNVKVEYQLKIEALKPHERKVSKPIYNANPRQLLTSRAADYGRGITDYSVTDKPRRYV